MSPFSSVSHASRIQIVDLEDHESIEVKLCDRNLPI